MNEVLWHYTIWLKEIISDGNIDLALPHGTDPRTRAVWFSRNPNWEATVKKFSPTLGRLLTFVEMTKVCGFGRIEVSPEIAPVNWKEYQQLTGMRRHEARTLEKMAQGWGASPKDWFVSFKPVDRSQWLAVEVWEGGRWAMPKYGWEREIPVERSAAA